MNNESGDSDFLEELENVRKSKAASYEVRSKYINDDGLPVYTNRLIQEESPYLLQHAHNPVNWYAWGDEAFAAAKASNKPVFLSIGYSTCHWCHVMEEESFDNPEVARILNEHFISIKVDREQRPDIDEIYMTAVQIFSGRGGWPMSSFLTPEGEPFFGGTYFPTNQFKQLLTRVNSAWSTRESTLRADAHNVTKQVHQYLSGNARAVDLDRQILSYWTRQIISSHDVEYGGFSGAPKFPNESKLLFLLDQIKRRIGEPDFEGDNGDNSGHEDTGEEIDQLKSTLENTLNHMAQGGIYDQIGGGFHRYSTDSQWSVPHFEKMLYNQALLGRVYAQSYFLTGNPFHREIARETYDYVLRDMTAPSGGFYSATDADSEGEEGKFFLWRDDELKNLLSDNDYAFFQSLYAVSSAGNFEGQNLLRLDKVPRDYWSPQASQWLARLQRIKQKLYQAREKRIHPLRDAKVITAWNGMMITSLALAAGYLSEPRYLAAAEKAADYIWKTHFRESGQLSRISLDGEVSIKASQEDYAYFAEGLLAVYRSSGRTIWLQRANRLIDVMVERFMDKDNGGFFLSARDVVGPLISNIKSTQDGAIPSGNSVALNVLLEAASESESFQLEKAFNQTLSFLSGDLKRNGMAHFYALLAVSEYLNGPTDGGISLASGHVHARAHWLEQEKGRFEIELDIDEGWHINADKVSQKELKPTTVTLRTDSSSGAIPATQSVKLVYPNRAIKKLSFQEEALQVFEGKVVIVGTIISGTAENDRSNADDAVQQATKLKLELQACEEQRCLAPESGFLLLSAATH